MKPEERKVIVSETALRRLLEAVNGAPHLIREMQSTRKIDSLMGVKNPIDQLIDEFNEAQKSP